LQDLKLTWLHSCVHSHNLRDEFIGQSVSKEDLEAQKNTIQEVRKKIRELTAEEYQKKAQGYFDQWFESANRFLESFKFNYDKEYWQESAFNLHQSTEKYYTTILLVFTAYRPKDHNLETLGIKVEMCDHQFAVFPQSTDEEKRLFELLKKAYIDARYKMDD
jgi:HEPN domain-containing protein